MDVFLIDTKTVADNRERMLGVLPPERVKKAGSYANENDVLLSLGAGYLAARFIGAYFADKNGKPRSEKAFFSLAHSGAYAAIAIADGEVGLDVEKKDRRLGARICKRVLSEKERAFSKGEPVRLLVSKESLAKADGEGVFSNIAEIPALPLCGETEYKGRTYHRRQTEYDGYYISASVLGKDFELEIKKVDFIDL